MTGLVPFAVLVTTVHALRGATVVGDAVLSAPIDPVTELNSVAGARPLIAVYAGDETAKTDGRNILEGKRRLELVLQIFLPESVLVENGGAEIRLDTRGLGAEVVFALLLRQCMRALQAGGTPWSELWKRFVSEIGEVNTQDFLFELPGKTRGFAREVTFACDTADEPEYGAAPYPFWAQFIDALRTAEGYGEEVAALVEAEISAQPGLPSWRLLAASQGDAAEVAQPLGFGPYTADGSVAPGEAPELAAVDVDGLLLDSQGEAP